MGLNNYKHDRLSGDLINLTDTTIHLYDVHSGEIWSFPPSTASLPDSPHFEPDAPLLHYIVKPEMAKKLEQSGRSLEDIAIISEKLSGRDGLKITYLEWGKNQTIKVRFYYNFRKAPYK